MTIIAKLTNPENGYNHDKEQAKSLDPNVEYVLYDCYVGRSSSSFTIEGLKGSFNTVQFTFYEDGRQIDIINRFYNEHDYY